MKCKYCKQINTLKKGKRNNIQRYYCKDCKRYFQESYSYRAYDSTIDSLLISLLKESCGVLGIARVLKISKNTVLSRMLKISKAIKVPYFDKQGCKFEVDEMFIKIANGENQNWLIYGIERVTKSLIGFVVGGRTKENISQLINELLLLQKDLYR